MQLTNTYNALEVIRDEYDDLAMCLTSVRQQARAINRRDAVEETIAMGRKVKRFGFATFLKTANHIIFNF